MAECQVVLSMWVYISVVETLSCPSISCTNLMSAPFSMRWVANECLNVCGEISFLTPESRAIFFTVLNAETRLKGSCLAKTCGSRMAAVEELIDNTAKDYAAISYLEDSAKPQKLLDNPLLLRQPIVRNGKTAATVGYRPDVWEEWK